jgi:hypothetical protein
MPDHFYRTLTQSRDVACLKAHLGLRQRPCSKLMQVPPPTQEFSHLGYVFRDWRDMEKMSLRIIVEHINSQPNVDKLEPVSDSKNDK